MLRLLQKTIAAPGHRGQGQIHHHHHHLHSTHSHPHRLSTILVSVHRRPLTKLLLLLSKLIATSWTVLLLLLFCYLPVCGVSYILASSISAGYTYCSGCEVFNSGTTLAVDEMMLDAVSNGYTSARFLMDGLVFYEKLTIDCVTDNPWSSHTIPLEVKLTNSDGTGTALAAFVQLNGNLERGSSVIIDGGTFALQYSSSQLIFTTSTALDGVDTLLKITGATINQFDVGGYVSIVDCSPLTVVNSAKFELSYNTYTVDTITFTASTTYHIRIIDTTSILIDSAIALIVGNAIKIEHSTRSGPISVYGVYKASDLAFTIANGGKMSIDNNIITVLSTALSFGVFYWFMCEVGTVTMTANSHINVISNTINITDVTASEISASYMRIKPTVEIQTSSVFNFTNNAISVILGTTTGNTYVSLLYSTGALSFPSSTLTLTGNTLSANNAVGAELTVNLCNILSSFTPTGGTVVLSGNSVHARASSASTGITSLIRTTASSTSSGVTMTITDNIVESTVSGVDTTILLYLTSNTEYLTSTVTISDNVITGLSGTIRVMPSGISMSVYVCRNTVNGGTCLLYGVGGYSCIPSAPTPVPYATACIENDTPTPTTSKKITKSDIVTASLDVTNSIDITQSKDVTNSDDVTQSSDITISLSPSTTSTATYSLPATASNAITLSTTIDATKSDDPTLTTTKHHNSPTYTPSYSSTPTDTESVDTASTTAHLTATRQTPSPTITSSLSLTFTRPSLTSSGPTTTTSVTHTTISAQGTPTTATITATQGTPTSSHTEQTDTVTIPTTASISLKSTPSRWDQNLSTSSGSSDTAKTSIPTPVKQMVEVTSAVAVVTVVPSAVIRAGIMRSVLSMLQCSEFDAFEEVGFISNPFNWAVGREELQYYRGSVVTVIVVLCVVTLILLFVIVAIRICSNSAPDWQSVIDIMRLPSLPLVVVLLVSEVGIPSATSMLFHSGSTAVDILLSLVLLFPLWSYMGLYVYTTVVSSKYIAVDPVVVTPETETPVEEKKGCIGQLLHYTLEPTDEVTILKPPIDNDNNDNNIVEDKDASRWLRRNFYFVAERRWAPFGALEVVGGTLTNMLEGIPMTTTSRTLCIARPACVMLITAVLLALLVWKVPNAVRLQQWCSLLVMGGMLITSALATFNAVVPSDAVEAAGGYIGAIVVGATMVLGVIETGVLVMTYVPVLRGMLSLRPRGLQSIIDRSKANNNDDDGNVGGALQVPMLVIAGGAAAAVPYNNNNHIVADPVVPQQDEADVAAHPPPANNPHPPPTAARSSRRTRSKAEEAAVLQKILDDLEAFEKQSRSKQKTE